MACEECEEDGFTRREEAPPGELDAYMAFLLEHTDLPRRVIEAVLDANDAFWEEKVTAWGLDRTMQWAQGELENDDAEPDGG